MRKNDPIANVMTKNPVTLDISDPVSKARKLFETSSIHHLPVVSGTTLVGILTWTDLMRISFGDFGNQDARGLDAVLDHTYKLADVIQKNPTTMPVSGTVRDAAQVLATNNFHSIPVVDGNALAGIVTSTDLIRYLVEQY